MLDAGNYIFIKYISLYLKFINNILKKLLSILLLFFISTISGQVSDLKKTDNYVSDLLHLSQKAQKSDRIKALRYLQQALSLEKRISETTLVELYHTAGIIYKDQESYFMALNYFYKELELQDKIDSSKSFFIYNNMGGCYFSLRDLKKARQLWYKSLEGFKTYTKANKDDRIKTEGLLVYNNIAVLEKEEGNYEKALLMLKEFKLQNESLNDTLNIIMANENLYEVYIKLNEKNMAIKELWKGVLLAKKINSSYDLASLYNDLGKTYLETLPQRDSCIFYLSKAYQLSNIHGFVDVKLSSSEKLVTYYHNEKNYQKALHYLYIAKSLSEETLNKLNVEKVGKLEFEYDEKITQKELIASQKKREFFFISGIILLFLFSVIILLMFKLQKSRSLKRAAENQLLAKKLQENNKVLTTNALQMLQTTEILQSTHKELTELESYPDSHINKGLSQIISDIKRGTQSFNKKEFEKLFLEIDSDFYKRLLEKYPDLTKNELRLCAFMRLNLSSKEISSITQQSPHSIVVARSRLRKKIGLEEQTSLTSFFLKF